MQSFCAPVHPFPNSLLALNALLWHPCWCIGSLSESSHIICNKYNHVWIHCWLMDATSLVCPWQFPPGIHYALSPCMVISSETSFAWRHAGQQPSLNILLESTDREEHLEISSKKVTAGEQWREKLKIPGIPKELPIDIEPCQKNKLSSCINLQPPSKLFVLEHCSGTSSVWFKYTCLQIILTFSGTLAFLPGLAIKLIMRDLAGPWNKLEVHLLARIFGICTIDEVLCLLINRAPHYYFVDESTIYCQYCMTSVNSHFMSSSCQQASKFKKITCLCQFCLWLMAVSRIN